MNLYENLPLGSVILIEGRRQPLIIIGRTITSQYKCVTYYFGYIGKESVVDVDISEITGVCFLGYKKLKSRR